MKPEDEVNERIRGHAELIRKFDAELRKKAELLRLPPSAEKRITAVAGMLSELPAKDREALGPMPLSLAARVVNASRQAIRAKGGTATRKAADGAPGVAYLKQATIALFETEYRGGRWTWRGRDRVIRHAEDLAKAASDDKALNALAFFSQKKRDRTIDRVVAQILNDQSHQG